MASAIRISILANAQNAVRGLRATTSAAGRTSAQLSLLERNVRSVNGINAKVSLTLKGFVQGTAQIVLAHLALDQLRKGVPDLSFGMTGIANKLALVAAAALAVTAATLPLVGAVLGLGAAAGAAGAGLALFAGVALPTIKSVTAAVTEYNAASHAFDRAQAIGDTNAMAAAQKKMASALGALTPAQRAAAQQVLAMQSAWTKLSQSQAPLVLGVMTAAAKTFAGIIPKLTPAITAVGQALKTISGNVFASLSAAVNPFVKLVTTQGVPALRLLATIIGNVIVTVGHLVVAFAPLGNAILARLAPLTGALRKLNFDSLARSAQTFLPIISKLFGNVGGIVTNLVKAAAPLAGPVLQALSDIAATVKKAFGGKEIAGFVSNIVKLVPAIAPIITVAVVAFAKFAEIISGQLLNLAPKLLPLVTQIANVFVDVLTGLSPLLPALLDLVGVLVSLLPAVFPVITALRQALVPVLPVLGAALVALVPSLVELALAMVKILPAITPLLPVVAALAVSFAGGLTAAVSALTPLLKGFADWASANVGVVKAIGLAVFGVYVAVNVTKGAIAAYTTVAKAWMLLTTSNIRAFIALRAEMVGNMVAAWARTAVAATASAARTALAWLTLQLSADGAIARFAVSVAATVAGWVTMATAATVNAAKVAVAWVVQKVEAAGALAASVASFAVVIGGWIAMGVTSLVAAAQVALAWVIALGPVGLIIIAIAAVVAVVVLLWKRCETFRVIVTAVWTAIKIATVAVFEFLRTYFVAVFNVYRTAFLALVNGVLRIWQGLRAAYDFVVSVFSAVFTFLNGLPGRLLQIGQNLMRGLVQGIQTGIQWVRDKVVGLGRLLPGWLQSVLGIHSPSTVMRGLGTNIMQGLADGITAQVPVLKRTIGGVADAITGLSTNAVVGLSTTPVAITGSSTLAGGNTYVINNTVAPGADPAEAGRLTVKAIEAYERLSGRTRLVR